MNKPGRLSIFYLLLMLAVTAAGVHAQYVRPDEYIETVQKKYLEPNGLDYQQLDEVTQARVIGYSLGMELLAAGMEFKKLEAIQRIHYMFLNRFGRRKPASKEMNLAYLGRYDAEMRALLGGAAPPKDDVEKDKPEAGFLGRLKNKK